MTKLSWPSASAAPRKKTTEPPRKQQRADRDLRLAERERHHAERADRDRDDSDRGQAVAEDQRAQDRDLNHLELGEGRADREVAEREHPQQEDGKEDLRGPAENAVDEEADVGRRQGEAAPDGQAPDVEQRERPGVEEAHVGGARGRQPALQMALQRRAQVLKERGGDRHRYPQFEHRPPAAWSRFPEPQ
jgi:hypothetical protein